MSTTSLRPVSRAHPCAACEAMAGCSYSEDGFVLCRKRTGQLDGFRYLGQAKKNKEYAQYRREGDPNLNGHAHERPANGRPRTVAVNWPAKVAALQQDLTPERRTELADVLGLPEAALGALPMIGYTMQGPHVDEAGRPLGPCWTFPEMDGAGRVVGIMCRYSDGAKKAWSGGERGLAVPSNWNDRDGPILIVEGPSDVLALTALNLPALGRPNNTGGAEALAELLRDLPANRPIVVVGEYDPKPDGKWPGRDGAVKVAGELTAKLGRPVQWALPPDGAKDVRAWVLAQKPDPTCADAWDVAGERLLERWRGKFQSTDGKAAASLGSFRWAPINSAAFAICDYRPRWLVKRVLVQGQPAIVGGARKMLKTSIEIDMAVSLATGTPFLGEFEVERPVRVAMLSGESGEFTLQETAFRVCRARDVDLGGIRDNLVWQFELPRLCDPLHLEALCKGLADDGVEVMIFDPLYLALLAGQGPSGAKAENLFDMGPLLLSIGRTCLSAGATPILIHHSCKGAARSKEPLELEDLAYAGIAEFARQWILLSRREPYEPGTGLHKLHLNVGGSIGHGGLWAVDVDEGVLDGEFRGRKWEVTVNTAAECRQADQESRDGVKVEERVRQDHDDDMAVVRALDGLDLNGHGSSYRQVRIESRLPKERAERAVTRLKGEGIVEEVEVFVQVGNGATRKAQGLRRCRDEEE